MWIALGIVAAIVVGILALAAFRNPDFNMARSITINAPPEAIFPYLNNPRKFEAWNPFSKSDPNIKMTFSGPDEGMGATSSWVGNAMAGVGSSEIVETIPNQKVRVRLVFEKPFAGTQYGEYTLTPEGKQTKMTWSMIGKTAFIPRIFCLFMNMDNMMGKTFDSGLANLKRLTEGQGV